jgi:hypothetical protein
MNFMHTMAFRGKPGRLASNKLISNILHRTLNPSTSYAAQINDSKFIHPSIPSGPPIFNTFDHISMQWQGWEMQHIPVFDAMVVIVNRWLLEIHNHPWQCCCCLTWSNLLHRCQVYIQYICIGWELCLSTAQNQKIPIV